MQKEYEYSSKVKDVKPFIEYCKRNGYKLESEFEQKRVLYKNDSGVLARVTTNNFNNGDCKVFLDFKDENESGDTLKVSRESGKIDVTDNMDFTNSMLTMLNFKLHKELKRTRYVYTKENVKFEIDDYKQPEMQVVGIEGNKEQVDIVYNKLEEHFKK